MAKMFEDITDQAEIDRLIDRDENIRLHDGVIHVCRSIRWRGQRHHIKVRRTKGGHWRTRHGVITKIRRIYFTEDGRYFLSVRDYGGE